ncbi:MAG: hypothetical protein NVS3B24_12900 [Candidatus Dormibacteria bacterium]
MSSLEGVKVHDDEFRRNQRTAVGEEGAIDLLARHHAASKQEAGCRQFLVHQALDDPARFFLYETYDSAERSPSPGGANISGRISKQCARRCCSNASAASPDISTTPCATARAGFG